MYMMIYRFVGAGLFKSLVTATYGGWNPPLQNSNIHLIKDLPKIMHWLNWYTNLCFNRMLNRTGHFWEKRYYSSGFVDTPLPKGEGILNSATDH